MNAPPPVRKLKMVIAYNGRLYHGWQRQAKGIRTVQEFVESIARKVLRHPLNLMGASRTDTGVHAEGQVAIVVSPNFSVPLQGLRRAINARLPEDIEIRSIKEVPMTFHPSLSADAKTYRYRLCTQPNRPVHLVGQVWKYEQPLDIERVRAASRLLLGRHDFASFTTEKDDRACTVRTLFRCDVCETDIGLDLIFDGDGFLYNMVRNLVGTLMDIGRGRWEPDKIRELLANPVKCSFGRTAPPDGLTLMCLHYPPEAEALPAKN
ncbi:MAG: tRNA pseudouridine(38-40) synthase TruA [Phycisphaerales bacterium]|jgi:tRNA pseudouridine38-40 synthase|nr:tRNA pseudouridine(38-40) synthase TruA [Phycisphaerales bacterium]